MAKKLTIFQECMAALRPEFNKSNFVHKRKI